MPAQDSLYYELLALTAICGELPCACADRLTSSKSYRKKVVTSLTHDKLLRIFSKDHLRGYRLGIRGKRLLRERAPERFQFYLSGRTDTNSIKSSPARRLRLHRIAQTYVTMMNAGAVIHRDEKPPIFSPNVSKPLYIDKEIQNKEKQNTDLILSEGEAVRTKVRDNIELDLLCRNQPESAPVMQEIYELVVETIQLRSPVLRLGSNLFPMALVRERLLQLTSEHIRFVLDGLRNLHTDVKNLKKYLLTMLFNAPVTLNGRTMLDVRKSVNSAFRPMLA